jgi:hypothetical protein
MAMQVRIWRPARTAMQSGRGNTRDWMLEYEPASPRRPEPLMGWVGSADTLNQVRLRFATKEEAVAFCERQGLAYTIEAAHDRRVRPRSYADNFKPRPV